MVVVTVVHGSAPASHQQHREGHKTVISGAWYLLNPISFRHLPSPRISLTSQGKHFAADMATFSFRSLFIRFLPALAWALCAGAIPTVTIDAAALYITRVDTVADTAIFHVVGLNVVCAIDADAKWVGSSMSKHTAVLTLNTQHDCSNIPRHRFNVPSLGAIKEKGLTIKIAYVSGNNKNATRELQPFTVSGSNLTHALVYSDDRKTIIADRYSTKGVF